MELTRENLAGTRHRRQGLLEVRRCRFSIYSQTHHARRPDRSDGKRSRRPELEARQARGPARRDADWDANPAGGSFLWGGANVLGERVDLGAVQPAVAALPEMGFEELALELGQLVIDLERDARARPFAGQLRSSARLHVQLRRGGTREVRAPAGCKRNAPSAQRSPQDYRRRQSRPRPARAA